MPDADMNGEGILLHGVERALTRSTAPNKSENFASIDKKLYLVES